MTVKEYLYKLNLYFRTLNEGNKREASKLKDEILEYNNSLVKKYPFLEARNVWTDEQPDDNLTTWLDDMPEGWRIAFGEQMCKEIKEQLVKDNCLREYRIHQIKEKFGSLRIYSSFYTEDLMKIIDKYEVLSWRTCIKCGKPSKYATKGWIEPYCEDCAHEIHKNYQKGCDNPEDCSFDAIFEEIKSDDFI